jgi:acetyltransferase
MIVIFGSPGLFEIYDVYRLLNDKMNTCKKPIYPILPSIINGKNEITEFISHEKINFPDEVLFGQALTKVYYTPKPAPENVPLPKVDEVRIREVINNAENGYLKPSEIQTLLDAAGIPRAGEAVVNSAEDAVSAAESLGFPVVMKVVGPVHKSDVGGVVLNVRNADTVASEFERMIKIKDTTAVLIQPMLSGTELFAGTKKEGKFGHLVLCGLGGIFIEVLKDVSAGLAPLSKTESVDMIRRLKSYGIIKGARGQEGVNEELFAEIIIRLSVLVTIAPEIFEMDLNPLLGKKDRVVAVDARIRIEK